MTEQMHTPGPWHFHELRPTLDGIGYIRCEGDNLEISHHGDSGRTPEENRANARLIAAAPDLLALLKEAADFVQPFNRADDLLDRIEAAIAKASPAA